MFVTICILFAMLVVFHSKHDKEGVVFLPSLFGITLVFPFSTTATHELVVPKSIPMTVI